MGKKYNILFVLYSFLKRCTQKKKNHKKKYFKDFFNGFFGFKNYSEFFQVDTLNTKKYFFDFNHLLQKSQKYIQLQIKLSFNTKKNNNNFS